MTTAGEYITRRNCEKHTSVVMSYKKEDGKDPVFWCSVCIDIDKALKERDAENEVREDDIRKDEREKIHALIDSTRENWNMSADYMLSEKTAEFFKDRLGAFCHELKSLMDGVNPGLI